MHLPWGERNPRRFARLSLFGFACGCLPVSSYGQVTTLAEAIRAAEANSRAIQVAELDRQKAAEEVRIAGTHRWPVFSLTALGSQPFNQLGVTLDRGSLGVYPDVGPIPGRTTTLQSPLRFGMILYATIAQPLTQQHRIGLGIELARVGVDAATEQLRVKRQAALNQVRRLYYGIVQGEAARRRLQAAVDFLEQLKRETRRQRLQQVALSEDVLAVDAQLAQAKYELLKLDDPVETQRQQLNRLMGRDVDASFEVDPSSVTEIEVPRLTEAYLRALESRPEVRQARLQVQRAALDRRIKASERIPDVSLTMTGLKTLNFSSVFPDTVTGIGLQATWDALDWGRNRREVAARRELEAEARLDLQEAEALVRIDVAHQHRRLIEARQGLEVAKALQAAGTESLRVVRTRYAQREALLSEVLKAQSSLADADLRFAQALMDLATAEADFEKAIGGDL